MRLLSKSKVVSQGRCQCWCGCKSSDASTEYADGSLWCFSCGHGKGNLGRKRNSVFSERETESVNLYRERLPVDAAHCKANHEWLKHYLDDDEISKHFFYCPYSDRHVSAWNEGQENEFYEARAVNSNRMPKSKQAGEKPYPILGNVEDSGVVVVVEDLVSAIKVSRQFAAMPLFGSYFPSHIMARVKNAGAKMCIIWLDEDKYGKGMEYAQDLGKLMPAVAVHTYLDPKACSDSVICSTIEEIIEEEELT